jgi:hypothetical protein
MSIKLSETIDCHATLYALFTRQMPFAAAEKIIDLLLDLEREARKYNALHDRLLELYGKPDTENEGKYIIPAENVRAFRTEMEELDKLTYEREKQPIPIIEQITPKELTFLREFFIFPETDSKESGDSK